jgi:hypothetical protein
MIEPVQRKQSSFCLSILPARYNNKEGRAANVLWYQATGRCISQAGTKQAQTATLPDIATIHPLVEKMFEFRYE